MAPGLLHRVPPGRTMSTLCAWLPACWVERRLLMMCRSADLHYVSPAVRVVPSAMVSS